MQPGSHREVGVLDTLCMLLPWPLCAPLPPWGGKGLARASGTL